MAYGETRRALEDLTDDRGFEKLVTILLSRTGLNLRPIGGPGDLGRDAVAGLYVSDGGEDLVVTISLDKDWSGKVRSDLARIATNKLKPKIVISVTNRPASPKTQKKLQDEAKRKYGVDLTISDQRWLIARLHLRENLDVRSEFLHLAPPRPHFFLDLGEYQELLMRRHLLDARFSGRRSDLEELEQRLAEGQSVIVEADGGYGKTRLAFELAASGLSATPWFFVDAGFPFDIEYLAETEDGYEVTILIDDAHRRTDLEQILRGLERRLPAPRIVFTIRPGHAAHVERALSGLALSQAKTLPLQLLSRSELAAILEQPPFSIERDAMLAAIIEISGGNAGIAVLAGGLAASGGDPTDLSTSEMFGNHVESRLSGAGLDSREDSQLLALVAAVGSIDIDDVDDVRAVKDLLGLDPPQLRRRLDDFADAGLVFAQASLTYAIKPDIVREHVHRFSFFSESSRPLLRYEDIYKRFAVRRFSSVLQALGEARVDTTSSAGATLGFVRDDLVALLEKASELSELESVMRMAQALGAGGGVIPTELVERTTERLARLDDAHLDVLVPAMVSVLAAAKFGRDQLPAAWRQLLRLGVIVFARPGAIRAREAVTKEVSGIFGSAPMNYSSSDAHVLAYMQRVLREETLAWWDSEHDKKGALAVGALIVRAFAGLQLERHRTSAANAMAINLVAGFMPATKETEDLLRIAARLFIETFLQLEPPEQLKQLEAIHSIAHVAGGYPGMLATNPSNDLQQLAESVVVDIEQWLADNIDELALPVAAAVLDYLRGRRRRVGGAPARRKVGLPRPKGEFRAYLDLVDNHHRYDRVRLDWGKELEETRARGAGYGAKLVKSRDALSLLKKWSSWIDQCEAVTGRPPNPASLMAALEHVGRANPEHARKLAEHAIENGLSIARFTDGLLDALVQDEANWDLIERWSNHASVLVRCSAVRATPHAADLIARPVLTRLASDSEPHVKQTVWRCIVYYSDAPLKAWRLNLALDLTESSESPLDLLDQVLARLRHRAQASGTKVVLTTSQKEKIKGIVLASANVDHLPQQDRVRLTLEELERIGIDAVMSWMKARLEYVKAQANGRYIDTLPDDIQPLLHARRGRASSRRELERLLDELEKPTTQGLFQHALEEAISWLGYDSEIVTHRVGAWAEGDDREVGLALTLVSFGNWKTFTKRARVILDARPDDSDVRNALIVARRPMSFIGSQEPYYKARADDYRRWLRSRDERLRQVGREAVSIYEGLAEEAAERERREQERI